MKYCYYAKKVLALILVFMLMMSVFNVLAEEASNELYEAVDTYLNANDKSYGEYYNSIKNSKKAESGISADISKIGLMGGASFDGEKITLPENGSVSWRPTNISAACYEIELKYSAVEGKNGDLDYSFLIDEEYPFDECRSLMLFRNYTLPRGNFKTDDFGNELPYEPVENFDPVTARISDKSGKEQTPFLFEIASDQVLTLVNTSCEIYIYGISLVPSKKLCDYNGYCEAFKDEDNKEYSQIIEGEDAAAINTPRVTVSCDNSTAEVSPAARDNDVMNYIGGEGWSASGSNVTWSFNVPTAGFYKLSFRTRQDYTGGLFVSRRLLIDGEIPFSEAASIEFPFAMGWQTVTLNNGTEDYRFYFTQGEHTLTLECVTGSISEYLNRVEEALDSLNEVYRRVLMLTGTSPDSMRDYSIEEKMPEIKEPLKASYKILKEVSEELESLSSQLGTGNVVFKDFLYQLEDFIADMEIIPSKMSSFQSNLSALATWINSCYEQPLDIDYFELHTSEPTNIKVGIIEKLKFFFIKFLQTFSKKYSSKSNEQINEEIEVWIPTARAKSEVIKNLITERFVPESKINVNVKLMSGSELNAIVAGIAPDVLIEQAAGEPVNYAMRKAVLNLKEFSDFNEVASRFAEATFIPFMYDGGCYALPETMSIPVIFYRTDIFNMLNIAPPKTWDDVYGIIAILSANNMQFGGVGFDTLLYQCGGSYYNENGITSALNTDESVRAFTMWTEFYSDYGLPLSYDFLNRFRSGEMPISIVDYTMANQLDVMAPEISGDWDVAPIPAMETENGLNNTAVTSSSACYIIRTGQHKNAAWEFIKWWTSADTQYQYTMRLENKLGSVARIAVSNLEALERVPWSSSIRKSINDIIPNLTAVEQVPGGYFTGRHLNNAFRHIVYYNEDVRETLNEYTNIINEEITERRKEFGLSIN